MKGSWCEKAYRQIVVIGVLGEPAIEQGPSEVINSVLLGGDGARDHLSGYVVVQGMVQVALHREGLEQKLLVVLLPRTVAHEHASGNSRQSFLQISNGLADLLGL